jgi:hypothetical protein
VGNTKSRPAPATTPCRAKKIRRPARAIDARPLCPQVLGRLFTGITNLSPDQTSLTAHTFTSTNPMASPVSRTTFPVRSVATPDACFGHEIHNIPAGASALAQRLISRSRSTRSLQNRWMKSNGPVRSFTMRHSARASRSSDRTSLGIPISAARNPALIPSFFGSGVPEYPGIARVGRTVLSACRQYLSRIRPAGYGWRTRVSALHDQSPTLLASRSVVSLAGANFKSLLLRKDFDGAEVSVGREVGGPV